MFERYSDADIAALDKYTKPVFDPDAPALQVRGRQFQGKLAAFLKAEGALAMVKRHLPNVADPNDCLALNALLMVSRNEVFTD